MKSFMKNNSKYLFILLVVILIILGLFEIIFFAKNNKNSSVSDSSYHFLEEEKEKDGTITYSNEILSSSHCLDNICIEEATFYYLENEGRVDYTIVNYGSETASGRLKMVFGNQKLIVSYRNVEPGRKVSTSSQYVGMDISNKDDYVLEKLTEEELSKIVVSNNEKKK